MALPPDCDAVPPEARMIALAFLKLTLVTFGLLYAVALTGMYAFQRDL